MKEEIKIPEGCEVDTITNENGSVVVTFKEKEPQLPKSWEEFCEKHPIEPNEFFINSNTTTSCLVVFTDSKGTVKWTATRFQKEGVEFTNK